MTLGAEAKNWLLAPLRAQPLMAQIIFSTFGARGDVFPYLAIARELQKRGHHPIIAASENYRAEVESRGLDFRAARPDAPRGEAAHKAMHPVSGAEFLLRRWLLPSLRHSIADLRAICADAALLVTHTLSLAGPIAAELEQPRGLKWVSGVVSPLVLFQPDAALPVWPRGPDFPVFNRALLWLLKRQFGMHLKATQRIRAELGLARGDNALWSDAHSPLLQLCLWDEKFAPLSPNSTRRAVGFCPLKSETERLDPSLQAFLDEGEAPLLFVAASFANSQAWERASFRAAQILGKRAVLLGTSSNSDEKAVLRRAFAPLDAVLPRVAAMIHAGGIGTLASGLDFETPMLLAPRAHDQPDNARRAAKLGLARALAPREYRGEIIAREIVALFSDLALKKRLQDWQKTRQNGVSNAADALEALL